MATRTNTHCVSWSHDATRSGVAGGEGEETTFGFGFDAT
jgi:hypothetical protein